MDSKLTSTPHSAVSTATLLLYYGSSKQIDYMRKAKALRIDNGNAALTLSIPHLPAPEHIVVGLKTDRPIVDHDTICTSLAYTAKHATYNGSFPYTNIPQATEGVKFYNFTSGKYQRVQSTPLQDPDLSPGYTAT
jgi:hypothetical protein